MAKNSAAQYEVVAVDDKDGDQWCQAAAAFDDIEDLVNAMAR